MATPAITSSIFQEIQSFNQSRRTDLQQLASALQSGNLSAAQQAFSDLASIGQNGPYSNGTPFANSSRAQAFQAIGQALQNGDVAGAQAAFATLQSSFDNRNNSAAQAPAATPAVVVNIGSAVEGAVSGDQNTAANTTAAESIFQQLQAFRQARQSDLAQLGAALQSGDTAGAQAAFNALTALGQNGPNSNGAVFQRSDRAQAFNAVGTALQNGDLAAAQQAFAALANSFDQNQQSAAAPATTAATPTTAPTVPEIVINLGGATGQTGSNPEVVVNIASGSNTGATPEEIQVNLGGAGGQLTIGVNQNRNGAQNVTLDFLQQNNEYKLAVDLLSPHANTTAQTNSLNVQA